MYTLASLHDFISGAIFALYTISILKRKNVVVLIAFLVFIASILPVLHTSKLLSIATVISAFYAYIKTEEGEVKILLNAIVILLIANIFFGSYLSRLS